MCVILACDKSKPSKELLQRSEAANPHGAGLAWLDGDRVRWHKALSARDIATRIDTMRLPFLIHFRIATVGGVCAPLTHPFPIEPTASVAVEGGAPAVLMHNGMWQDWERMVEFAVKEKGVQPPQDKSWSDSRAMAWLAALYGEARVLKHIAGPGSWQKVATLKPKKGITLYGGGWIKRDGMWLSNEYGLGDPPPRTAIVNLRSVRDQGQTWQDAYDTAFERLYGRSEVRAWEGAADEDIEARDMLDGQRAATARAVRSRYFGGRA
jgi:hypothetical protein